MSVSTTRLTFGLILILLAACSCGGPTFDTGALLLDAERELTDTVWERDLGRALEFPPVWAAGSWIVVPTEGALWRLDAQTGKEIWKKKLPATPLGSPLVFGDIVVIVTDAPAGEAVGYRLTDGEKVWTWGRALTQPAGRDSILVLAARGGRVLRLDPRTGDVTWSVKQAGAGWKRPLIGRDLVVVPVRPDSVLAFSIEDGETLWGQKVGAWPELAESNGLILSATDDSMAVLLDSGTGIVMARLALGSMPAGQPVWDGNRIILALRRGAVVALDAENLDLVWERHLASPLVSAPQLQGDRILQAGPRGLVHVLNSEDGEWIGVYRHPERLITTPAVAGERIAVSGDRGTLVVYRRQP